ncbi:MAG: tRNA-dihydrouridine synthase, partial [Terracidiphilus sp.]|nr:tRNA-dihydrouridine synthase [Terracidiphilus sp.]
KMKQFATWFTHGVPGGAKLRAAIYHARTGAAVLAEVEGFFMPRLEAGLAFPLDASDATDDEGQGFPAETLVCD